MKTTLKILSILAIFFAFSSCNDDDDGAQPNQDDNDDDPIVEVCDIPNLNLQNTIGFSNPCAVAVASDGKLAVTTYNQPDGSVGVTKIWSSYQVLSNNQPPLITINTIAPEGAVFDSNGNLFVSETEQIAGISVFLKAQNYTLFHKFQGGLNNPRGLAMDGDKLYIADDGNGRIVSISNPTQANSQITQEFSTNGGVKALAVDDKNFYYVQYTENKVVKRSKETGVEQSLSVTNPVDISIYDGNLYVTSPNHKLTVIGAGKFSNDCMETFNDFGASFGTAHYQGLGLIMSSYDEDKLKILKLN